MANGFWDEEKELARFPKNERGEEIVVKSVAKKGRKFIDIRTFYPGKNDEMLPGKGISVPEDIAPNVAEAITNELAVH